AQYLLPQSSKIRPSNETRRQNKNQATARLDPVQTAQKEQRIEVGVPTQICQPGRFKDGSVESIAHLSIGGISDHQVVLAGYWRRKRICAPHDTKRSLADKVVFRCKHSPEESL